MHMHLDLGTSLHPTTARSDLDPRASFLGTPIPIQANPFHPVSFRFVYSVHSFHSIPSLTPHSREIPLPPLHRRRTRFRARGYNLRYEPLHHVDEVGGFERLLHDAVLAGR